MIRIQEMNIAELAAYLCSHLSINNIKCVLSGGACVSIYTENKYQSYDLDFIEEVSTERKYLKEKMLEIGFYEENRYFKNDETNYFIEFPTGPLSIGSEPVKVISELELQTGKLLLLSPTDCIKDRLAAYYFWGDLQSLDQAILVAKNNDFDLPEIKRWSEKENQSMKFDLIKNLFVKIK